MYDLPLRPLEGGVTDTAPSAAAAFPVRIEASDLCGRFTARIVRNVSVGPSSGELAAYFEAIGQKPISNAVDITNFVWLAMGHPTHVFDLDTIEGGIVVRRATAGEKLVLLDGVERTLTTDDLVVADERKALGLAGVMGGWDSRVTEQTKNILVEAAWFLPSAIRASSRRHGLHTDASHRFERGADFAAAPMANALVADLLTQYCAAAPEAAMADVVVPELAAATLDRAPVMLRVAEVHRHLGATADGVPIPAAEVARIVRSLGCLLSSAGEGAFEVQLPSWRLDLEREIDLIEEVARVYGYNRFANTLPAFTGSVIELPHKGQEQAIRESLRALGFSEAISSTFVSAEDAHTCGHAGAVPMGNPLSAEAGFLRPGARCQHGEHARAQPASGCAGSAAL